MATRGRKPKPTELKIMTGNPGKRPLPESEPDVLTGDLEPPAWIDEKEKSWRLDFLAEWKRITDQLEAWGVLGPVFQGLVERVCAYYANASKADRNGDAVEARQSGKEYRQALNEFGLTLASKGRVGASTNRKKPKDKADGYFTA